MNTFVQTKNISDFHVYYKQMSNISISKGMQCTHNNVLQYSTIQFIYSNETETTTNQEKKLFISSVVLQTK